MLEIQCRRLPDKPPPDEFTPGGDPIFLVQSWLESAEDDLMPGIVGVGWRPEGLLVTAVLLDSDVYTAATQDNQRLWELGDAFEMFLCEQGSEAYVELHVTPNNHQLRLHFPNSQAAAECRRTGDLEPFLLREPRFESSAFLLPENQGWSVVATIPCRWVSIREAIHTGDRWHFSFCRYDAARNRSEPVLSSSSDHSELDFHRKHEWGRMTFVE